MAEYNEDAYRQARKAYIELACPFERALLSRCVACDRSRRLNLAEREAIACGDAAMQAQCVVFHHALHEKAQFALKINPDAPWPFGKEIRAQCGGVRGLAEAIGAVADETTDVADVLREAQARYADADDFPYSEIMRAVVHYEPRRRRS